MADTGITTLVETLMHVLVTITELGMLAYWAFATLVAAEIIWVPAEWMYSDYRNPTVVAWNWSFLPLDILFAVTGLGGRFLPLATDRRIIVSTFSLSLMFCAGLMAISFWINQWFFDPFWWGVNLWLLILPIIVLGRVLAAPKEISR